MQTLNSQTTRPYLLWQLIDSALPTGALSHSGGLEAFYQINPAVPLYTAVYTLAAQALAQQLYFVDGVHRHPDEIQEYDHRCHALITNHVARRASLAQGNALLSVLQQMAMGADYDRLRQLIRIKEMHGHLAPVFGYVFGRTGSDVAETRQCFAFVVVRDLFSSAVRLGICGPMQAQREQHVLLQDIDRMIDDAGRDDAQNINPLQDVMQGMHDRLYSRLFSS